MEKREELKQMYSNIILLLDSSSIHSSLAIQFPDIIVTTKDNKIATVLAGKIPTIRDIDDYLLEYFLGIEDYVDEYLQSIENDHLKLIAINRLEKDFRLFHDAFSEHELSNTLNLILRNIKSEDILSNNPKGLIKSHYRELLYSSMPNKISDIEFDLIGATPIKRKEKQELSLSQIQINLLFHSLIKTDVVINISKDVAEGLSKMTGLGVNLFKQDLNNPFREGNDTNRIPKDVDFVKVINSLQKSIDYLKKIKTENEIK